MKYVHVQTFVDLAGKGGGKYITEQRLEKLCLPGTSIQTEKTKTKFFSYLKHFLLQQIIKSLNRSWAFCVNI